MEYKSHITGALIMFHDKILFSLQIDFFEKFPMYQVRCMEYKKQNHIARYILKIKLS